jgi:hypothetical protein
MLGIVVQYVTTHTHQHKTPPDELPLLRTLTDSRLESRYLIRLLSVPGGLPA